MTPHSVAVGQFEGPLGLLLELVERKKIEVTEISVAQVTANYLERVKKLEGHNPEELSDFLQLGARLLFIKSLALLPQEAKAQQAEELRQLNLELDEYRRLQAVARQLERRTHLRSWERQVAEGITPGELPPPNITLEQRAEAFTRTLRTVNPIPEKTIARQHITLESVLNRIRQRLKNANFDLQELLDGCRNRLEVIVTFLALLELMKEGVAQVTQTSQFSPIRVEANRA